MTPYEITSLGIVLSFYLMKWLRNREKKLGECLWDYLDERKEPKPKSTPIITGQFNTLLRPGLRESFQEVYYPGKMFFVDDPCKVIFIDPAVEIYDEEYWRTWKRKHKHEDDLG